MNCVRTTSQPQQIQQELFNLYSERKDAAGGCCRRNCEKNCCASATYFLPKHMCLLIYVWVCTFLRNFVMRHTYFLWPCNAYIYTWSYVCVFTVMWVHACQLAPARRNNNNCSNCANNSVELGQPNGCPTHKLAASAHTISRARTLLGVKLDRRVNTHTCESSCVKCARASSRTGYIPSKSM